MIINIYFKSPLQPSTEIGPYPGRRLGAGGRQASPPPRASHLRGRGPQQSRGRSANLGVGVLLVNSEARDVTQGLWAPDSHL